MPALTDTAIRHALKRVEMSQKQENLADGEGRGTGRLVLVLKPMPKRVTADWMAQQWRDGKRSKKKIGAYPSMSLAQAREIYKRDFKLFRYDFDNPDNKYPLAEVDLDEVHAKLGR